MQTFTFTIDQIKEIYEAGIQRGSEEATAFEWGSNCSGGKYDEAVNVIHDMVNVGKVFGVVDDWHDYDTVREWFK